MKKEKEINEMVKELIMKYQYYFYELYTEKVENYLREKNIHYQKNECNVTGDSLVFSIWSNISIVFCF